MLRHLAIVFTVFAFLGLQAHNLIAHKHESDLAHATHHHHTDGRSHSHHDDPQNANDSHNPEFGKYLLNKHENGNFNVDQPYIIFQASIFPSVLAADKAIRLYYISLHENIPRQPLFTTLHFRGPPALSML
jgi:hypothetical protein